MKRDWDLIRKQLTDVEEENDLFFDIPPEPKLKDLEWNVYEKQLSDFRTIESRIFGHWEMLVDSGFIKGLQIIRSIDGSFHYALCSPRLTMEGYDFLDTIRSVPIWEKIKTIAKAKGIELTVDSVKALGIAALNSVLKA